MCKPSVAKPAFTDRSLSWGSLHIEDMYPLSVEVVGAVASYQASLVADQAQRLSGSGVMHLTKLFMAGARQGASIGCAFVLDARGSTSSLNVGEESDSDG